MNYRKKIKAISTKGLINKFSIFNGSKYLYQENYKIFLYLYQLKNTLNNLMVLLKFIPGNLMECQKKVLKI